ncbi:TPA: L-arginine responsive protein LaoB [Escherichia coli]
MLRLWEGESVSGTAYGIGGGEDSIISSPSSSLYQITGTINL